MAAGLCTLRDDAQSSSLLGDGFINLDEKTYSKQIYQGKSHIL